MRHARPLLLLAFLAVLAGVGATYYSRLKQQARDAPAKPVPLPEGTNAKAHQWEYTHTSNQKTVVKVKADDFREVDGKDLLAGVTLDIMSKDANEYDRVTSAKAEADLSAGTLYSEGEVEIAMKVPADQQPTGKVMLIKSSGVHVEIKTGKSSTDRAVSFQFDRGEGKAVGANYDPNTRQLDMRSQVELIWRGTNPKGPPMKIEAGQVNYSERESKVVLWPWSRLTRDTMTLEAGPAVVTLDHGIIKRVEAEQAHGTDHRPERTLEYAANHLTIDFNQDNQIQKITAVDQAKLVSSAETAITTMTSDRVTMDFDTTGEDSILQTALAIGHSQVEAKPVKKPGAVLADTRILKSDEILTKMRAAGQEIESVETHSPGAIEFVPNRPDQPHRWMNGERISIAYGPKNQIQSFRSNAVTTKTVKPKAKDAKEDPAPELTWSQDLLATFQPNSSQLDKLEQSNDFRYEAGDRKAKADRAVLDQKNNRIDLIGKAHIIDSNGSAAADTIQLHQDSGDFTAEGNVSSTRMPDKSGKASDKKDSSGGMLAEDEPLHARAKKMLSTDNRLQIRYEGNAVLWQGADRLEADVVDIDRDNGLLKAHGHVVSQLLDKDKSKSEPTAEKDPKRPATNPPARVFTIVRAPELSYDDDKRVAEYSGGAMLERSNMEVKAKTIRAFLRNDNNDSSLHHAFADGQVQVHSTAQGRARDGTSEHAEYYVDDDKVILSDGRPKFVDSLRGTTQGDKLTWFSKDDRLLVNGVEAQPVKSVLHRKAK